MKLRLSANVWVLIILAVIIVAVGSEAARVYLQLPGSPADNPNQAAEVNPHSPSFKVGDPAPDFSLKDKDGKPHSLSSLVKRDTLLCFICGCNNCQKAQ